MGPATTNGGSIHARIVLTRRRPIGSLTPWLTSVVYQSSILHHHYTANIKSTGKIRDPAYFGPSRSLGNFNQAFHDFAEPRGGCFVMASPVTCYGTHRARGQTPPDQ